MLNAVDSFHQHVRNRIIAKNPNRAVKEVVDAADWPPKELALEAFYLIVVNSDRIGREGYSQANPIYHTLVQWVWAITGSDIDESTRGKNRGDRYRTNNTMKIELVHGLFPGFTEKKAWGIDQGDGSLTSQSFTPKENILWTPPNFMPRRDDEGGILHGAASVTITHFLDTIAA